MLLNYLFNYVSIYPDAKLLYPFFIFAYLLAKYDAYKLFITYYYPPSNP